MKRIKAILSAVFVVILGCRFCLGDFQFIGVGARPAVFGNSYVAMADDTYGIYYNPGGLAFARCPQISAEYGRLWMGMSDESLLSNGFIGGIYPVNDRTGVFGCALQNFSLSGYYSESNFDLVYSKKFLENLGAGINIKQLSQSYIMDQYTVLDEVFKLGAKTNKTVTGLDLGVLWRPYRSLFVGGSFININQPDIGFAETESLPSVMNLAVAYRSQGTNSLNIGFGISNGDGTRTMAALEKWFSNNLWALRCGFGSGSGQYFNMSVGASVSYRQAQIDYAFILPAGGIKETLGTQRISLTYSFGRTAIEDTEKKKIVEPYEARIKELESSVADLQSQLKEKTNEDQDKINEKINALKEEMKKNQKMEEDARSKPKVTPPAEKEKPAVKTHVVKSGESLPSIAQEYYGDSSKWKVIFEANKNKIERGQIVPGQVLVIP